MTGPKSFDFGLFLFWHGGCAWESDMKNESKTQFPTEAVHDGKPVGSPSMTDIMVIAPGIQMAVEGKFTEYVKGRNQTMGEWLEVKMALA